MERHDTIGHAMDDWFDATMGDALNEWHANKGLAVWERSHPCATGSARGRAEYRPGSISVTGILESEHDGRVTFTLELALRTTRSHSALELTHRVQRGRGPTVTYTRNLPVNFTSCAVSKAIYNSLVASAEATAVVRKVG